MISAGFSVVVIKMDCFPESFIIQNVLSIGFFPDIVKRNLKFIFSIYFHSGKRAFEEAFIERRVLRSVVGC